MLRRRNNIVQPSVEQLQQQIAIKEQTIEDLKSTHSKLTAALSDDPKNIVQRHIELLKTYNELRDMARTMVRRIADTRNVSVSTILDEMGAEVEFD